MSRPADMAESQARNEFGYIGCPSVQAAPGAAVHSHVDQSTNKALPWIATSMLISGMAVVLAIGARMDAQRAEREARMLQMYVLELDAKLIAVGYKTDAEALAKKLREIRQ